MDRSVENLAEDTATVAVLAVPVGAVLPGVTVLARVAVRPGVTVLARVAVLARVTVLPGACTILAVPVGAVLPGVAVLASSYGVASKHVHLCFYLSLEKVRER